MRNERFERYLKNEQRLYSLLNTIEIIDKLKRESHRSRNTISSSFYALDIVNEYAAYEIIEINPISNKGNVRGNTCLDNLVPSWHRG